MTQFAVSWVTKALCMTCEEEGGGGGCLMHEK